MFRSAYQHDGRFDGFGRFTLDYSDGRDIGRSLFGTSVVGSLEHLWLDLWGWTFGVGPLENLGTHPLRK